MPHTVRLAEPSELGGSPPECDELDDEDSEDAEHAECEGVGLEGTDDIRRVTEHAKRQAHIFSPCFRETFGSQRL